MTINNEIEEINSNPELAASENSQHQPDDGFPENDSSLEALVNQEQTLARENLREKLGREPTREEINEWLNAHTESY